MPRWTTERVSLALAVVSLSGTILIAWAHNDKDISNRIVKVETRQDATDKSLDQQRAETDSAINKLDSKIDKVQDSVNRLVTWALGKQP